MIAVFGLVALDLFKCNEIDRFQFFNDCIQFSWASWAATSQYVAMVLGRVSTPNPSSAGAMIYSLR